MHRLRNLREMRAGWPASTAAAAAGPPSQLPARAQSAAVLPRRGQVPELREAVVPLSAGTTAAPASAWARAAATLP